MVLNEIFGAWRGLGLWRRFWQWLVARRFPLYQRAPAQPFAPAVTLLKPLKGWDGATEDCLRSWLSQDYTGRLQILFGTASSEDPVCKIVSKLLREYPTLDAQLVVCVSSLGANPKVSKLVELDRLAKHDILVISDADVRVPPDFLTQVVAPLREAEVGLVNCFYQLANPSTLAMQWEAIAINADFWSQVLQARSLKPLDFALGAVMVIRREQLEEIGGFRAVVDCLADDYQLGNRIARLGLRIAIWPLLWLLASPSSLALAFCAGCCLLRGWAALDLQQRLTRSRAHVDYWWFVPIKDLLQAVIWLAAFLGNRIEWRGERMLLRRDGTLVRGAPQLFEH